jgi:hypothetical protein
MSLGYSIAKIANLVSSPSFFKSCKTLKTLKKRFWLSNTPAGQKWDFKTDFLRMNSLTVYWFPITPPG